MVTKINWGSMHLHSKFSDKDALDSVELMVEQAHENGWGAMGLTDHGNTAGIYDLHGHCKKNGILDVPGCELYVTYDRALRIPTRWHMCVLANTTQGWDNLVALVNRAHKQFFHKPVIDLWDLLSMGDQGLLDGLWATTGCFFGLAISPLHPDRLLDHEVAIRLSTNMVGVLNRAFNGRVLVELMNHRIENVEHSDTAIVEKMMALAEFMSLACIVTSDSHYASRQSIDDHKMLKRLISFSKDPDDAVFPGEGYWVPTAQYMKTVMGKKAWEAGLQGFGALMEGYALKVPDVDKFTLKMPALASVRTTPERDLMEMVDHAGYPDKHRERVLYELDVICDAGFAPYILLTKEVTDYCHANNIRTITRGSACGSMVCHILGISQIDPVEHGLLFERFISRIRTSPPDIDVDVQDDRRHEVLEYLASHYAVCHIGTWRKLSSDLTGDKGSLWVKWKMMMARNDRKGEAPTDAIREGIESLSKKGAYDGIGKHAAGLLIVQDEAVLSRIPQQYVASSKTFVTSLDKDGIERLGYIKLDVLGLQTLTAIVAMEATTGVKMEDIPMGDTAVYAMIRMGHTEGVFQLSGWAQRRGLPVLRPKKFEDIVVALALFRPAVMQSGAMDTYLACRNGSKRTKHHEVIEKHVSSTHGVILFQEQVISILRDLGMTPEDLNIVLKAVKASNSGIGDAEGKMRQVRKQVFPMASDAGFTDKDIEWLERALQAYASYGFNRAHAVSYAYLAYRTAWYKKTYPVDFWAAMLHAYTGDDKETEFKVAMQHEHIMLLPPHINKSKPGYSIDEKFDAVRAGLVSVKKVGPKAAQEIYDRAPYYSLEDMAQRVNRRWVTGAKGLLQGHAPDACGGVVEALHHANAFLDVPHTNQEVLVP